MRIRRRRHSTTTTKWFPTIYISPLTHWLRSWDSLCGRWRRMWVHSSMTALGTFDRTMGQLMLVELVSEFQWLATRVPSSMTRMKGSWQTTSNTYPATGRSLTCGVKSVSNRLRCLTPGGWHQTRVNSRGSFGKATWTTGSTKRSSKLSGSHTAAQGAGYMNAHVMTGAFTLHTRTCRTGHI